MLYDIRKRLYAISNKLYVIGYKEKAIREFYAKTPQIFYNKLWELSSFSSGIVK